MTVSTSQRIFNFSAGPAVLPLSALQEAQRDLVCYPGAGASVMEMSHRGKVIDGIIKQTEARLRRILGVPESYHVLFLQGGASLQFSMLPMNFLGTGGADYLELGAWSKKAMAEARKVGQGAGGLGRARAEGLRSGCPRTASSRCAPRRPTCT